MSQNINILPAGGSIKNFVNSHIKFVSEIKKAGYDEIILPGGRLNHLFVEPINPGPEPNFLETIVFSKESRLYELETGTAGLIIQLMESVCRLPVSSVPDAMEAAKNVIREEYRKSFSTTVGFVDLGRTPPQTPFESVPSTPDVVPINPVQPSSISEDVMQEEIEPDSPTFNVFKANIEALIMPNIPSDLTTQERSSWLGDMNRFVSRYDANVKIETMQMEAWNKMQDLNKNKDKRFENLRDKLVSQWRDEVSTYEKLFIL
jgi:hypothetical protein